MNIKRIFDNCNTLEEFGAFKVLLNKIMTIKTPMYFDDDFASEEELVELENELDRIAELIPIAFSFKRAIITLPAIRSTKVNFI